MEKRGKTAKGKGEDRVRSRRKSESIKHPYPNKTTSNPEWRSGWIEANVFRENRIASGNWCAAGDDCNSGRLDAGAVFTFT